MVEDQDNTDGSDYQEIIDSFQNPNVPVKLFALAKLKRTLNGFSENKKDLSVTDSHLLKGFYTTARKELELEHIPYLAPQT